MAPRRAAATTSSRWRARIPRQPKEVSVRALRVSVVLGLVAGLPLGGVARAAPPLQNRVITPLSLPAGIIGQHMKDSIGQARGYLRGQVRGARVAGIYDGDHT